MKISGIAHHWCLQTERLLLKLPSSTTCDQKGQIHKTPPYLTPEWIQKQALWSNYSQHNHLNRKNAIQNISHVRIARMVHSDQRPPQKQEIARMKRVTKQAKELNGKMRKRVQLYIWRLFSLFQILVLVSGPFSVCVTLKADLCFTAQRIW